MEWTNADTLWMYRCWLPRLQHSSHTWSSPSTCTWTTRITKKNKSFKNIKKHPKIFKKPSRTGKQTKHQWWSASYYNIVLLALGWSKNPITSVAKCCHWMAGIASRAISFVQIGVLGVLSPYREHWWAQPCLLPKRWQEAQSFASAFGHTRSRFIHWTHISQRLKATSVNICCPLSTMFQAVGVLRHLGSISSFKDAVAVLALNREFFAIRVLLQLCQPMKIYEFFQAHGGFHRLFLRWCRLFSRTGIGLLCSLYFHQLTSSARLLTLHLYLDTLSLDAFGRCAGCWIALQLVDLALQCLQRHLATKKLRVKGRDW